MFSVRCKRLLWLLITILIISAVYLMMSQHFRTRYVSLYGAQEYSKNKIVEGNKIEFAEEMLTRIPSPIYPEREDVPLPVPSMKVLFCWIPKVACTQIKALECRVSKAGDIKAMHQLETSIEKVHNGHCAFYNRRGLHDEVQAALHNSSWTKLAVIRDPISRTISGWANKCYPKGEFMKEGGKTSCFGCEENFNCFAEKLFKYFRATRKNIGEAPLPGKMHIDHFEPQYDFCDLPSTKHHYRFVYYNSSEEFRIHFRQVLLEAGFPKEIINSGWGEDKTLPFLGVKVITSDKTYKGIASNAVKSNLTLANILFRTYFVDYVNLNFPVPDFLKQLCEGTPKSDEYFACRFINQVPP